MQEAKFQIKVFNSYPEELFARLSATHADLCLQCCVMNILLSCMPPPYICRPMQQQPCPYISHIRGHKTYQFKKKAINKKGSNISTFISHRDKFIHQICKLIFFHSFKVRSSKMSYLRNMFKSSSILQ